MTVGILEYTYKYPHIFPVSSVVGTEYILHDPKLVKEILLEKGQELVNHTPLTRSISHPEKIPTFYSLISIRDDEWKKRRKVMSPFFTLPKILPLVEIFRKQAEILCDILSKNEDGSILDIQYKFANLTADILGESVFGSQFNSQIDPSNSIAKAVASVVNGIGEYRLFLRIPYWYKFPFPKLQRFLTGTNQLMNLCRQMVQQHKEQGIPHNDLLQCLIDLNMDMETALIPESFLFLIAGHETTATLLSWAVYLIAQHPEVEKKILEEIIQVIGPNGEPTADNIPSLEYIDCVIQETLRLYPPAVVTDREVSVETVLDGHKFPKNCSFMVPIWAIHHNEKYWPNPEKFDPTRFDTEHKQNIQPFSWLPFGVGPRMCIGSKLSLVESKVVLAKLYQKFSFQLVAPTCTTAKAGGLLKPEQLLVKLRKI